MSVNETPWGGSEELWYEAALALADAGHEVCVLKPRFIDGPRRRALRQRGCRTIDLARPFGLPMWTFNKLLSLSRIASILWLMGIALLHLMVRRPQLVLLSQGGNWDGVHFGWLLLRLRLPYAIVSQKAAELYWPPDGLRRHVQSLYRGAHHAFFVSAHNLQMTEFQIGERVRSASVVRNPFLVPFDRPIDWPEQRGIVKIACVGRLYPMEKGQDLLLQVLAQDKWRDRPISLTFFGDGVNSEGLEGMATLLGLRNVRFAGQVEDVSGIWRDHHLLVLPSRSEGLPLVIIEAMLAGRVVVASNAGGNAEAIDEGVTGFVCDGWSIERLDEAMERAWSVRDNWPQMGLAAAALARRLVPAEPGLVFASAVARLVEAERPARSVRPTEIQLQFNRDVEGAV